MTVTSKSTRKSRLVLAALAASTLALSACAPSIPPGSEVADELIDSQENLSDETKECLHAEVADFAVPVAAGTQWKDLDDVAEAADGGDAQAQAIIDDFFVQAFKYCEDPPEVASTTTAD